MKENYLLWKLGGVAPNFFDNFIVVILGSELAEDIRESVLGMLKKRLLQQRQRG
jgi:hypothetical protein